MKHTLMQRETFQGVHLEKVPQNPSIAFPPPTHSVSSARGLIVGKRLCAFHLPLLTAWGRTLLPGKIGDFRHFVL